MEMRHPHSTITVGVRQPSAAMREVEGNEIVMTYRCFYVAARLILKQNLDLTSPFDAWQHCCGMEIRSRNRYIASAHGARKR
jgi:hypothetical protein